MDNPPLYIPDSRECMTCGFCIPHCPTFKVLRKEADSPRGRLRTLAKLLSDEEDVGAEELTHLANCLQCRACEAICPSKMPYTRLMDAAGPTIAGGAKGWRRLARRVGLSTVAHPWLLKSMARMLRGYQITGLRGVLRRTGVLRLAGAERLDGLSPRIPAQKRWRNVYPASDTRRGAVGLFTGCITDVSDRATLSATIRILNHCGYDVHVPKAQRCCGAVHLHNGDPDTAAKLAQANVRAFAQQEVEAVIYTASGCGLMLTEYANVTPSSDETNGDVERFTSVLKDASEFLADITWPEHLTPRPLNKTVAVHEPCSQTNGLGNHKRPYELLERIPGIKVVALENNTVCCGAGGTHMITHPEIAEPLLNEKIEALRNAGADILVTSNISCAMHLIAGIKQAGLTVEVLHPATLLARQLDIGDL